MVYGRELTNVLRRWLQNQGDVPRSNVRKKYENYKK